MHKAHLLARARRLVEGLPATAAGQLVRADAKRPQAFAEGAVDEGKREIRVILITEGPGNTRDRNYYTREAVLDGVKKFNGAPAHLNHPTEAEEDARPEKDVRTRCGFYKDTAAVQVEDPETGKTVTACEATLVCDESPAGDEALAKAKASVLYRQTFPERPEVYTGLSIHSGGWQEGEVEIDGEAWAKIVGFDDVRSVDVVTTPARGGAFLRLLESAAPVGGRNTRRTTMSNAEKIRKLMNDLTEADARAKAETRTKERKVKEGEAEKLRLALRTLLEHETEGEEGEMGGAAGADPHAEPDGDEAPAPMDAMKKLVPKGADESDEAYSERLAGVMKAAEACKASEGAEEEAEAGEGEEAEGEAEAKPKEGEGEVEGEAEGEAEGNKEGEEEEAEDHDGAEPAAKPGAPAAGGKGLKVVHDDGTEVTIKPGKESAAVKKLRKDSPALYKELMAGLRESLGEERKDFAGVKKQLAEAKAEIAGLRLERDLQKAKARLQEAGIPEAYLAPADLVKLDKAAQDRQIARMKLALENGSSDRIWSGSGPAGNGRKDGAEAILTAARESGLPMIDKAK